MWTKLYIILPLTVGLLIGEHVLPLTSSHHRLVLLLLVAFIYTLIAIWIESNSAMLEGQRSIKPGPIRTQTQISEVSHAPNTAVHAK